jgi:adenylosuccinate lyase
MVERRPLAEILGDDENVRRALDAGTVARLLAPGEYLGQAEAMIDRVLTAWEREQRDRA